MFGFLAFAYAHQLAATTSYQATPLTANPAEDRSRAVPQRAVLGHLELEVSAISGASTATVYLAHDAAGDRPMSTPAAVTLVTGVTTATLGGGIADLDDLLYVAPDDELAGTLYLVAKVNAGTATISARLFWRA